MLCPSGSRKYPETFSTSAVPLTCSVWFGMVPTFAGGLLGETVIENLCSLLPSRSVAVTTARLVPVVLSGVMVSVLPDTENVTKSTVRSSPPVTSCAA